MSDGGGDEGSYNDSNRAFLQAFISRGSLTYEEAKPILAAILTACDGQETLAEDVTEATFNAYVSAANQAVSPLDLEIRSTYHQITRTRIYALVNMASDAITQLATIYTADEISYLKRVLDGMFETNNTPRHEIMAITSMQAVRLHKAPGNRRETQDGAETQSSSDNGLTMAQAEKMLESLVEQGWFEPKSRKGYFTLSPRALMELRGWLTETYNDVGNGSDSDDTGVRPVRIKFCYACKEIVTVGQRCPNRSCQARVHDFCTRNFFLMQKSSKCPQCKRDWTGDDFVGERAAPAASGGQRQSAGGASRRQSGRASGPVVAEEAEAAENGGGAIHDDDLYD